MSSGFYNQLLVCLALTFGATVGIADAVANAAVSDAEAAAEVAAKLTEVAAKLAEEPSAAPSVTSAPLSVGPESAAPSASPSADASVPASGAPASEASSAPADVVPAALDAVKATQQAVAARNLPAWLLAFSSILWLVVAFLRRYGRLNNRKAVAAFTLLAAVVGGLASQMLLGVNVTEAVIIALGGPGAVALNEFLRAFGIHASSNPGSGDIQ
jgi:hypothetical protein